MKGGSPDTCWPARAWGLEEDLGTDPLPEATKGQFVVPCVCSQGRVCRRTWPLKSLRRHVEVNRRSQSLWGPAMKTTARTVVLLAAAGATVAVSPAVASGATPTQTLKANSLGVAWIGPGGAVPTGAKVSSAKVTILVNGRVAARLVPSAWAARGTYTAVSSFTWRPRADRWGSLPANYLATDCRISGMRVVQDRTTRETYVDYVTKKTMTSVYGQATIGYTGMCTASGSYGDPNLTYTSRWNSDDSFYFTTSGVPDLLANTGHKVGDMTYLYSSEVQVLIPTWGAPVSKTFTRMVRIV